MKTFMRRAIAGTGSQTFEHYLISVLYILILATFAMRVFRLDFQPIWFDEDLAFQRATADLDVSLTSMAGSPLYYLLLRGWVGMAGASLYVMRFFSVVCGTISAPLIYQVGRRLFSPRMALCLTVLSIFAPFYVYYSQEARTYALTLVWMLVSMNAFLRWRDNRRHADLLWCSAANLICLYTHYVAALMIAVQGAILLTERPIYGRKIGFFAVSQALVVTGLVPWLVHVQASLPRVVAPPDTSLLDPWSILARTWTEFSVGRTIPPPLSLYLASAPLFLALVGLLSMFTHKPPDTTRTVSGRKPNKLNSDIAHKTIITHESRTVLCLWLIIPIIGTLLIPRASVRFSPKYLIAITPVFYSLILLGLQTLRKESRLLFSIGLGVLICLWLYALGDYYLRQHDKLAQAPVASISAQVERRPTEIFFRWS